MRYALVLMAPLLLGGCWEAALASIGASVVTRLDGFADSMATRRDIWYSRGQQIDNRAIEMLMNIAQKQAAEGNYEAMKETIEAARDVHRSGRPNLPFITPPTYEPNGS